MSADPYKEVAEQLRTLVVELNDPQTGIFKGMKRAGELMTLLSERMPMIYIALTRHTELASKQLIACHRPEEGNNV